MREKTFRIEGTFSTVEELIDELKTFTPEIDDMPDDEYLWTPNCKLEMIYDD